MKNEFIGIRATKKEREKLQKLAAYENVNSSVWIRNLINVAYDNLVVETKIKQIGKELSAESR